jgi:hypothetical protein
VGALTGLYEKALAKYTADTQLAEALGSSPQAAARTLVASTVFNCDKALSK